MIMSEPAAPETGGGLTRIWLQIAYDGTGFSGWASQPGRRTVQGVLTDALSLVLRCSVALTVAGRTDAGVHASGQVAHADVPAGTVGFVSQSGAFGAAAIDQREIGRAPLLRAGDDAIGDGGDFGVQRSHQALQWISTGSSTSARMRPTG